MMHQGLEPSILPLSERTDLLLHRMWTLETYSTPSTPAQHAQAFCSRASELHSQICAQQHFHAEPKPCSMLTPHGC